MSSSIPSHGSTSNLESLHAASHAPEGLGKRLASMAPAAIVVLALLGLAVWGHRTNWTLPRFSQLIGGSGAGGEAWCNDHNVPEAECIECHPNLLPPGPDFGWCSVHGVAQCPFEHPEVAQVATASTISPDMLARADRALTLRPRVENNSNCLLYRKHIQFASAAAIDKAGVDIAIVRERPVLEAISSNGELVYNQNRMAHLSSRVAGTVWRVEKQIGDAVRKGDVLALVDAAEIGRAKTELLQAIAQMRLRRVTVERMRPLSSEGTIPAKTFDEALTALEEGKIRVQSAQQSLVNLGLIVRAEDLLDLDTDEIARQVHFLGLPAEMAADLDPAVTTSNLFPLRASLDGLVVERNVVEGEVVDTTTLLFTVADFSRLWLTLNVRQEDAKYVRLGQTVLFQSNESNDEPQVVGEIDWISTAADDRTRTIQMRVELPNPDGRLRANTYGTGKIVLREERLAMVVPSEAVHWDGTCNVVFVRDKNYFQPGAPKFFHVRSVRPGVTEGDLTEIIAGVLPGEVVASKNSVVLQAQLLKSGLGAGCCEACAPKK